MILRYLGLGKRRFGEHPMPAHPRLNWEFLAVIKGRLAPFDKQPPEAVPLLSNHFWLFPPGVVHGWVGAREETCELIVVHFSSVPPSVERLATKSGYLETRLKHADLKALNRLVPSLKDHYWHPTMQSELRANRALMDLCLLVIRDYKEQSSKQIKGGSLNRITAAEEWLQLHLTDNPSIASAARHVGLSTSQLCRCFTQIRNETPQNFLNKIKIERAMELLGHSDAKLEKVALDCGFSSASNLCRAFKAVKGRSPSAWRREMYIQHKEPRRGTENDYRQHGRRVRPAI